MRECVDLKERCGCCDCGVASDTDTSSREREEEENENVCMYKSCTSLLYKLYLLWGALSFWIRLFWDFILHKMVLDTVTKS